MGKCWLHAASRFRCRGAPIRDCGAGQYIACRSISENGLDIVEGGGLHTYSRGEAMVLFQTHGCILADWFPAGADEYQVLVPSYRQAARSLRQIYDARQTRELKDDEFLGSFATTSDKKIPKRS